MELDVLLMFVTGAGLWALGRLARMLPQGELALATVAGLGGTRAAAERVQAGRRRQPDGAWRVRVVNAPVPP